MVREIKWTVLKRETRDLVTKAMYFPTKVHHREGVTSQRGGGKKERPLLMLKIRFCFSEEEQLQD